MRNTDERLALLHKRASEMQRKHDRTALILQGSGSAVLMIAVIAMVRMYSGSAETFSLFTGATLLDENTGGYVLVAVIAFMAGTLLTAYLIRNRRLSGTTNGAKERREENHEVQDNSQKKPEIRSPDQEESREAGKNQKT
jgi:hypothetical protein